MESDWTIFVSAGTSEGPIVEHTKRDVDYAQAMLFARQSLADLRPSECPEEIEFINIILVKE